jgi:C4-dicarboxylate transporter DctM subunit
MWIWIFVLLFSGIGAPVFTVIAGATQLAWLGNDSEAMRYVRFLAPDVLDERFTGSPILVTVPLFTLIGYVMAESKTPERIVRASNAFFGWMPGGLAIVCIFASAFFTTLTGGSAVTIVAIGALLYPALISRGYPKDYALGLVMTGGSLGLLLPPSLPILVYSLVAGIDFTKAFKASVVPGMFVLALMSVHAAWVAHRSKVPRVGVNIKEMGLAFWVMKWEIGIPVLILGGLFTGLTDIDEIAAVATIYVIIIEVYVYKDLKLKDMVRISRESMALAGAVILIMATSMSLTNWVINAQVPDQIFDWVTGMGMSKQWHFLVALNVFLYILGAVMDGFSSILVAVPLLIPIAAKFHISPFHLATMFLLNLEIAYLSPPLGQNLYVAAFRFNVPMVRLFKVCIDFMIVLTVGLLVIMWVPRLSTIAIEKDIVEARAKAEKNGEPPREVWMMECVQEDRNNPLPCSDADREKWGKIVNGGDEQLQAEGFTEPPAAGSAEPKPDEGSEDLDPEQEKELKEMLGEDPK